MGTLKKAGHIAKRITSLVLMSGVIASVGLLSYCGMLAIHPSLVLAWTAFALAGFVDGEVFYQNINSGIGNLKLLGNSGLEVLLIQELDKAAKHAHKTNVFLRDYHHQTKYVNSFKDKTLTKEQKKLKKAAEQRLRRMQKIFIARVLAKPSANDDLIVNTLRAQLFSLKKKVWLIRASVIFSVATGIAFGFATAAALSTALATMTVALSATIWPLAIIACIGYSFLIYNNIANLIRHDKFQKWYQKIKSWFKRNDDDSTLNYGLRITFRGLLLLSVLGIVTIATVATAGTWWLAVKNGAELLPLIAKGASVIRTILVPIAFLTTFTFTASNALQTIKEILRDLKDAHPIDAIKNEFLSLKTFLHSKNINWWAMLNPFNILVTAIKLPFNTLVFIGHLAAVGLTGDRAPGLSYRMTIASAVFGAASDGLVDYHYITNPGGHHHHDHGAHKGHDHNHGLITDYFLNVVLCLPIFLSAVWHHQATGAKKPFTHTLAHFFGVHQHKWKQPKKPLVLSNDYLLQEMQHRVARQGVRLDTKTIEAIVTNQPTAQKKMGLFNTPKLAKLVEEVRAEYQRVASPAS